MILFKKMRKRWLEKEAARLRALADVSEMAAADNRLDMYARYHHVSNEWDYRRKLALISVELKSLS